MSLPFRVDSRRWTMWEMEFAEYNAGTPYSIEYGIQEPLNLKIDESAMYRAPDFSKNHLSVHEERDIGNYEPTKEEIERTRRMSEPRRKSTRINRAERAKIQKQEDAEEFDWYNTKKNEAGAISAFLTAAQEREIALGDETKTTYILDW